MITSLQNIKIRQGIALQKRRERDKTGLFVIEGKKMMEEVPIDWTIKEYFIQKSFYEKKENQWWLSTYMYSRFPNVLYSIVDDTVFQKLSDTQTPQGVIAIVEQKKYDQKEIEKQIFSLSTNPFFLLIEEIQDPGNLGTLIRTADAAGATGIILSKGTVDLYSPKVIRSTMGSIFHLPIITGVNLLDSILTLQEQGIKILAAHLEGILSPYKINLQQGIGILIGNEGRGLTEEVSKMTDYRVKLPMIGKAESLNAAIAGGILLYEVVRQRMNEMKK